MKYTCKKSGDENIEIISDNQAIISCNKDKENFYKLIPNYCKFIIYSDPEPQSSTITNKIIIQTTKNIDNKLFDYDICNYTFISFDLYIQNELKQVNYDLNLFFNGNNYYVVNNKIDKYVICFLLYSRYGVYHKPEFCKYKINIIDQNANMVEINENDVLHLYKEKYEVIRVIGEINDDSEESEESEESEKSEESKETSEESYEKIKN